MSALFSIIVPSLNQPEYLEKCLESIIGQDGVDLEIIVIDGGSSEESLNRLRRYEKHLTHFVSEPDNGQADAINKGLAAADGSIVGWLNTDDFYEPQGLSAIAEAYREEPDRPFYLGNGYRIDTYTERKTLYYPADFEFQREALLWGENPILQPAAFINAKALAGLSPPLDPNLHYAMDTDLWIRLSATGNPLFVDRVVANNREHPATKTSTGGWRRFEEIRQVAQRHTGCPLTPGALHVLLSNIDECAQNPDLASRCAPLFAEKLEELWQQTGLSVDMLSIDLQRDAHYAPSIPSGGGEQLEVEAENFRKALVVLEKDRIARGAQVEELVKTITSLTGQISQKEGQIKELTEWLRESETDRAARLENNDKLTDLIKDRDSVIVELREEIKMLQQPFWKKLARRR